MYSLFMKDYYLIRKHLWIAILYSFMVLLIFNPQAFEIEGMTYTMGITMIGYTMIMYITAYDDKNNSEVLLNSLPISKGKIILARYLSVFAFSFIGVIGMLLSWFVLHSINIVEVSRLMEPVDYIGALVGLCTLAFLYLPTYYKFGYVKAKMFNLLLFAVAFGGPIIIRNLVQDMQKPLWIDEFFMSVNAQSDLMIGITLLAFILVMGIISYSFSLMIYRKREF